MIMIINFQIVLVRDSVRRTVRTADAGVAEAEWRILQYWYSWDMKIRTSRLSFRFHRRSQDRPRGCTTEYLPFTATVPALRTSAEQPHQRTIETVGMASRAVPRGGLAFAHQVRGSRGGKWGGGIAEWRKRKYGAQARGGHGSVTAPPGGVLKLTIVQEKV